MASSVNRRIEGYLSRVMGQRDPAGLIRPRPTEPIRACGLAPRHQAGHMTAIGLRCRHAEKSLRGRGHPHMTRGPRPPATECWRPADDRGSISASNPGAAVPAGQIEKLALDLGEQAWRKEAVGENPRSIRYGLEPGIRPLIDIVLGDDNPTRFVVQPDRSPHLRRDLDPDGIA